MKRQAHQFVKKASVDLEEKHFPNQTGYPTTFTNELHLRARKAAGFILRGTKDDADKLIRIVRDNPQIKTIETEVKDVYGNTIKGTLLQIAAIVGEVNAITGEFFDAAPIIHDVKHCGFFEMLLSEGALLPKNALQQFGIPGLKHDTEHTIRISKAIIQFGEGILNPASNYQELKATFNQVFSPRIITSGFAFDIKILHNAAIWFAENRQRFNDEQTLQFWEDGFNQLLNHMSARDKQLLQAYIFSDSGLLEYQFEAMSKDQKIKESDIPDGKIYLAPEGSYILRNVDGEIHKGKIEHLDFLKESKSSDRSNNEYEFLKHLGTNSSKENMLTLISQNGHIQLTPKTTIARSLKKEEDFSPKENLLFIFNPFDRAKLVDNPHQLAQFLKGESYIIAGNFSRHRTIKRNNLNWAVCRAEEAAFTPKSNACTVQ